MSSDSDKTETYPGSVSGSVKAQESRVCPTCKTPSSSDDVGEFCPVCMLRAGLSGTEQFHEEGVTSHLESSDYKFEHYELVRREDDTPVELGRGAMGVTYKAEDINLKRPVALKVINNRYLKNESMRQRFVSEARAAASLRHPNVASVFHLGKTGEDYFYAMEFVEGEPLDRVLKFRGPLDVGLALEIVYQAAAALSAAYRTNLVHRDIKPGNLMVVFGDVDRVTVKVIDFGIAKALRAPTSDGSSETGMFVGTPHFASPEQCAGKEADIRSDLYSLGVTFWVILAGKVPFEGTASEVMEKHLHEMPPIERLEHVPKLVVSLMESLLEKDPSRRIQTPFELQTMIQEVREALETDQSRLARTRKGVQISRGRYGSRNGPLIIAISLVLAIAVACFYLAYQRASPNIDPKSVAVLPFDNVGDDKQNEYFSDGLTGEVIFQLSKISNLRVIARSSVFRYKAVPNVGRKSLREIGYELNVATILESSAQRMEDHVKIQTILYDAQNEKRLWGRSYNREIKDLFAVQTDLAENIAAALQVRLSADERSNIQHKPTENLTAYDLYLRGMAFHELRHQSDNERAIGLFRDAIDQDAKFALGYAGLANAYIDRVAYYEGEMFWLDSAIDLCRQAIALDPRQVRGYTVLARASSYKGLHSQARELTKKALELAPNDVEAIKRAIYDASAAGELDEEYALLRKCSALDPNDPSPPYTLARICATVGEKELMEKSMQRAIDIETDPERHHMMECERRIFRRDFAGALIGLRDLRLNQRTYAYTALEFIVACSARVGDWRTVMQLASARLEEGAGNWSWDTWALSYLALAAHTAGQQEVRQRAERLIASVRKNLGGPEPNMLEDYYLALGNRFLERREETYQHLRAVFPNVLTALCLTGDDPSLQVFAPDTEFQDMMSDAEKRNEKTRKRIREIEKNF